MRVFQDFVEFDFNCLPVKIELFALCFVGTRRDVNESQYHLRITPASTPK